MSPSVRSRSNHPRTDRSAVLTVPGPRPVRRRSGRLRPYPAGSPVAHAVSSSLPFGTKPPSAAASHPALRRRSCLRLPRGSCLRGGHDFHMLSSWCCGRTGRGILASWFGFTTEHSKAKPAARRTRAPPRISPMARIKNDPWHPCDPCPSEDEARCLGHDGGWLEGACARIVSLGVNSWLPPPSGLTTRAPRAAFQPRVATARRAPAGNPDRCGARSHRST